MELNPGWGERERPFCWKLEIIHGNPVTRCVRQPQEAARTRMLPHKGGPAEQRLGGMVVRI